MLKFPGSIVVDSSGNLIVADSQNDRISRYSSAGAFTGWTGKIATSPTGGAAGCAGAAAGTATPGWCTGGTATTGNADGNLYRPLAVTLDSSGNIYVAENSTHRISKFNSSGVFQGWIGRIASSPTGGAAGCNGAAGGTATPGWCTGGTSQSGSGNGHLNAPRGVTVDSSGNLYVSDSGNRRISKFNSSGVFVGWIGRILTSPTGGATGCNGAAVGTFTPGWCTGGTAQSGSGDGMMITPEELVVDSSGDLYVPDVGGHRILKFNSAGAFQGWLGKIATSPTGGAAGCNGATVGTATPGWCTGGTATGGTGDAMLTSPLSVALDSSANLLVVESNNHRISKFSSAGVFLGWTGNIGTSPTGGAAGCSGAAAGTLTPGWCTGGTATGGKGDGMLDLPESIALDSSGNLLIADSNSGRIHRYNSSGVFTGMIQTTAEYQTWGKGTMTAQVNQGNGIMNVADGITVDSEGNIYSTESNDDRINKFAANGTYLGWIGLILTSPTGGAAGCAGASVGTFTPGWCTGGSSDAGSGNGAMNAPYGIAVDSSGNIFLADTFNHRISKYTSAGAFVGWIGKILTSPTGGAAGCAGATVGTFTPGWCTGGTAGNGNFDGALNNPYDVTLDSAGNLYVTDATNNRISKYSSTGAFVGWTGRILTSPTGGAAGCAGAAVGSATPGWCTGGTPQSGTGDGMLSEPYGVELDASGNLYVTEGDNHRISKFDSAGVFQGWAGGIATTPTGGAPGCSGAAAGTITPGWCTGGTSQSGTVNGMMDYPSGIVLDSGGNIYLTDTNHSKVNKYGPAGNYLGWIGGIATSPSGGGTGCNGAPVGGSTPGWCTGGTAVRASGDGQLGSPYGLTIDRSGNVIVAEYNYGRIMRYPAVTK